MADSEEDSEQLRQKEQSLSEGDLDEIAEKLLNHQFVLTALEFHTELVESGLEIPRLRDFFSNPGNFERQLGESYTYSAPVRSSSNFTLDSLDDLTCFSDDGHHESDEKVAESYDETLNVVLEFELRKAQETIKALRGSLTEVAGTELASPDSRTEKDQSTTDEPMKPHEKRAVNFLVNEYLLNSEYRLTSVTFCDENADQDFDDWDEVGLNVPKPPDLLHLYRDYGHHTVPEVMLVLKAVREEKNKLEELSSQLQAECKRLEEELGEMKYENQTLLENVSRLESEVKEISSASLMSQTTPAKDADQSAASNSDAVGRPNDADEGEVDIADQPNPQQVCADAIPDIIIEDAPAEEPEVSAEGEPEDEVKDSQHVRQTADLPPTEGKLKHKSSADNRSLDHSVRRMSPAFKDALMSYSRIQLDSRLAHEVSKLSDADENVVFIIARCLPHIVPNVLLNKREELIPVIICTAIHHPESSERDKLLHMLFNLIKRPDDEQRQMIMNGCAAFAHVVGPTRIEAELLPQWWEQINHKYHERRLLVAEACGGLAPYIPAEIRGSLVWSMLKQMLSDDRSEAVREAVTKSLGLVVTYIGDTDKYEQAHDLFVSSLDDEAENVVKTAQTVLLPSLAAWAQELGKFEARLLASLLVHLESSLNDLNQVLESTEEDYNEEELNRMVDTIRSRVIRFIEVLTSLVPMLFAVVLQSAPFAKTLEEVKEYNVPVAEDRLLPPGSPLADLNVILGSTQLTNFLIRRFDKHISQEGYELWDALSWVSFEYIPKLIAALDRVHNSESECIQYLVLLFSTICVTFGRPFTDSKIRPFCLEKLDLVTNSSEYVREEKDILMTSATLPVLAAGILGCFETEENIKTLTALVRDSVITLSNMSLSVSSAVLMYQHLSTTPAYHQMLIGVLWEIVVHSESEVRCSAAPLFRVLITGVDLDTIGRQVLPALVTLASDSHMSVRAASIPAFGAIVGNVSDAMILEKVYVQFQSFLEDPQYKDQHEVQITMIRTFAKVGPQSEPHFRDEVLLPRLAIMASINNNLMDDDRRREIALELLEAYVSLTCCFISSEVLSNYIIPGLKCVKEDVEDLSPEYEETVSLLIRECQSKMEGQHHHHSFQAAASTIGQDIKNTFMSRFNKLKDVSPRPKMSDLFKRKERTGSIKSFKDS